MKKSLYTVTLAALLIMALLTGCYSERMPAQTAIPTEGPEKHTASIETGSAVDENKPAEAKEEKPANNDNKPVQVKEEKSSANDDKPAQVKEEKSAATEAKPAETKKISRDEAKTMAISHANVAENKVRDMEIELEKERGITFYEVTFDVERLEYEYAIDAYTGEILYNRTERD